MSGLRRTTRPSLTRSLRWIQDDAQTFSLCDPERQIYSTLHFEKATGSLATGKTSEGQWSFKRVGFFKPCISVRPVGREAIVAVFRQARLQFAGGRVFLWKPTRSRKERGFEDLEGHTVVRLRPEFGHCNHQANLEIGAVAAGAVELSVAVLISWYIALLVQRQRDVDLISPGHMMMMSGAGS